MALDGRQIGCELPSPRERTAAQQWVLIHTIGYRTYERKVAKTWLLSELRSYRSLRGRLRYGSSQTSTTALAGANQALETVRQWRAGKTVIVS